MIRNDDAFVKKDHKPVASHGNSFHRYASALIGELYHGHWVQEKDRFRTLMFPTFALFLDIIIQQTTIISLSITSFFISTTRLFDYSAR